MKRVVTSGERAAENLLMERCRGMSSARTIQFLSEEGILSHTHAKAFLARSSVAALVRKGVKKTEAILAVAEMLGCSEGSVRNYVYYNYK